MTVGTIWKPTEAFLKASNIARFMRAHGICSYEELIRRSTEDIDWFWKACVVDLGIEWFKPYSKLYDDSQGLPWTKWFVSGELNITHNCLDRHRASAKDTCLIWEGDNGVSKSYTYEEVALKVGQLAATLLGLGVKSRDAVGIYMPMIPEVVVALFACFKIGAVAVPIFSGFGPEAVGVRLADSEAKIVLTADGGCRRGKIISIKPGLDLALRQAPNVKKVIVVKHTGSPIEWNPARDLWWHEEVDTQKPLSDTLALDSEHPCMILYTSGTTGKPKGCVHTQGGALVQIAKELAYYFDVRRGDRFFWFTDIGWMMGPWEMIGVLFHGATLFIYEGAPDWPEPDRVWKVIEKQRLSHLGISPTAIRLLKTYSDEWVEKYPLRSLRILGSTGEPWDPESYLWYFEKVGKKRCPIINISGGTELVGCLLSPLPITELKPCTLRGPGLGMDVDVFGEDGGPLRGEVGYLVCKKPFPSMTRGFLKDRDRYLETYFSKWPGVWNHSDWAYVDEDGFWFLHGRADDTIKVAGKRVGPAEVESALNAHPAVAESAAIGIPHEIKGEVLVCFVVLKRRGLPSPELREGLKETVVKALGKTLAPERMEFVSALPKTRSAKIVRGAIRRKYLGQEIGDLSSVENPEALRDIPQIA